MRTVATIRPDFAARCLAGEVYEKLVIEMGVNRPVRG